MSIAKCAVGHMLVSRMRRKVTLETLEQFMRELAGAAGSPGKLYFAGGATALLLGFRHQKIDINIKLDPEPAGAFEAIADLKNRLDVNVELASPADFIPAADDWRERSRRIRVFGKVEYFHYDFALQALAKVERGHEQDLRDARDLVQGGFVSVEELQRVFSAIEPKLVRYPAIEPPKFAEKVAVFLKGLK
jgi:hypothetical protein